MGGGIANKKDEWEEGERNSKRSKRRDKRRRRAQETARGELPTNHENENFVGEESKGGRESLRKCVCERERMNK